MRRETIISFVLAGLVVFGAFEIFGHSLHSFAPFASSSAGHAARPDAAPADREKAGSIVLPPVPAGQVVKCTVNGKTLYSNEACPDGATAQPVRIHESGGIVSPKRESLQDLTEKRLGREREYNRMMQVSQQAVPGAPHRKSECDSLDQQIRGIESMARQPQSGQMQDWLKQEKVTAQNRQYDLKC